LKLSFVVASWLGIGTGLMPALAQPNQPPQLSPITDKTINEGSLLIFNASATDPDIPSQTLTFSLETGAPEGAAISVSGLFTWTPSEAQGPGSYTLRVVVADSGTPSLTATQSFNVTVQEVNFAPTLGAIANRTVNEGELVTFTANATDPDLPTQTLTYTLGSGAPTGATIDANSGVFTWTPSELQGPGTYFISVAVADNGTPSQIDSRGFSVTVQEVNRPPELPVLSDLTVNEGTFIGFGASPTDPDIPGQSVNVTLGAGAPAGASINGGGFFIWTPSEAQGPSTNRISIIAADNGSPSLSTTQSFTVIVLEANLAPTLDPIADRTVNEGEPVTFNAVGADLDLPAQSLTFVLGAGAPAGASINPGSGAFTWTPTEAQGPGIYSLSVTVTDNATPNLSAARSFNVTVQEINLRPVLATLEDRTVNEGSLLIFNASATDADVPSQNLTFSLGAGAPEGAAISAAGLFTWTPGSTQGPSTNRIAIIVTDSGTPSLSATQSFTATVLDLNGAPALNLIPDQSVNEGVLLTFTASATDPDQPGQTLIFSLGGGAPAGAAIDALTGVFTWTPVEAQGPATNILTVTVADTGTPPLTASRSFTVIVREVNRPPVIAALEDRAINSGALMIVNVIASDPDIPAQGLAYSLGPGAPSGAAISAGGVFTWTPTAAQSPSTNRIAVIVADNGSPSLTATQHFNAIVTDLNGAPVIAAIPNQTANEGQQLTFIANATDPDQPAQTLTFSLGPGAPDGAAIDPNTGVFSWTPSELQGPATNFINVLVTDSGAPPLTGSRGVTVVVNEVNRPPELDPIADHVANVGGLLIFSVTFRDPDIPVQIVTVGLASGAPQGAALSSGGLFTWTPSVAQASSTNTITVIASDNGTPSLMATQRFTVTVQGINHAPTVATIADRTVNEGALLTFTASASDPEQPLQSVAFSLGAGAPDGAAIDPNTGVFTWTPAEIQGPATNIITVVATDNGTPVLSGSRSFSVVVSEVNAPPQINPIADQITPPGNLLVFGVAFTDPDVPIQTLTVSLGPGAPAGAEISPGGLFTWTPTTGQSPSTNRIAVIVTDSAPTSFSVTQFFTVTVVGVNRAPSLAVIPNQAVSEGALLTFIASGTDPDQPQQILTYSLGAGAPDGAAIDPSTGIFTWTPSEIQGPATNVITVVVADNGLPVLTAARAFTVVVNEVNRPPELDPIPNQIANVGGFLVFGVVARDPDVPIQTVVLTLGPGAPAGAAISPGGLFTWTPTAGQASTTNTIAVIASDGATPSLTATQRFTVTVQGINHAPDLAAIPDKTVNEGQLLTFTASATDPEQPLQTLTFSLGAGAPDGATINPNTGVFTWIPSEIQGPATNFINVIVTDNGTPVLTAARGVNVVINEVNRPPELDPIADHVANVGGFLVFGVVFRDPDIPIQTLTATLGPGAPAGAAVSPGGLFTWTPTAAQAPSTNLISVILTDNGVPSLSATQRFSVTVGSINRPPTLEAIPDRTVNEGELLTFTAVASDPEQPLQSLAFSLGAGAPDGAVIDPNTGVFTWIPSELQGPVTNLINVIVSDNGTPALTASRGVIVMVNEVNRSPELDPIADRTASVGSVLVFSVTFRDPDIPVQTVTLSLGPGAPDGAAITAGGLFTWTPTASHASSVNIINVIASDGTAPSLTATQRFTVTVGNFNRAPTLEAIPDQTINEGELLTFSANASDPEQPFQSLTYTLGPGAPVGANLDPATGVFTWTPLEVHGPETNLLSVTVTDNGVPPLSVAGNIRIVVNEVNRPPFFLPDTNQIVNVGSPLIFNVDADDLDIPRNTLTFTLGPGAPAGAVISARGEFSWRPTAGQGPATNFVTVFVSDGGVPPLRDTNTVRIDVIVGAPLTPPVLREPTWDNNIFNTVIDMIAGRRYSLEGSDSASQPNWRVVEAFQGRGAPDTMTDRNATNRHRIYRARVE
jgi:uncharacterized protein (UPF0179 family)